MNLFPKTCKDLILPVFVKFQPYQGMKKALQYKQVIVQACY